MEERTYLIDTAAWPERARVDEISTVARRLREDSHYVLTMREAIGQARTIVARNQTR